MEVARNTETSVQIIQEHYEKQATPTVFAQALGWGIRRRGGSHTESEVLSYGYGYSCGISSSVAAHRCSTRKSTLVVAACILFMFCTYSAIQLREIAMDNRLNEIRRKIRFLRSEMLTAEDLMRKQINRDEDCTEVSLRLMAMRTTMLSLIGERDSLGGSERLLDVEEQLKADGQQEALERCAWPP